MEFKFKALGSWNYLRQRKPYAIFTDAIKLFPRLSAAISMGIVQASNKGQQLCITIYAT